MSATATVPGAPKKSPRRAALASWIGSALEYYDFAVYGTAAAIVLNHVFFPGDEPGMATVKSMLAVGVAYVVRPFGAMLMGPLGDKFGRKFVLMLTLFLMGGATFAIGCLPTYAGAGWVAPALLVLCRVLQGLSASGEQASAISMSLEHADDKSRAFTTSWTLQGTQFGSLLATAVFIPFAALPEEQLYSWGWRVPFWLSAVVVVAAWLIRRRLQEPPAFRQKKGAAPLKEIFRHHMIAVLTVAICALVNTINMVFTTFALSFATTGHHIDKSTMLWVPVASNSLGLLAIPLFAKLSDRIGRKPVFIGGALLGAGMMFPYLYMISQGNIVGLFVCGILMHGGFYSMANGIWPSFYAEMFPTRVRVTGLALGTQIGFALSGQAPALAAKISGSDLQNWVAPSAFTLIVCVFVAVVASTARETSKMTLDEIDEAHEPAAGVRPVAPIH